MNDNVVELPIVPRPYPPHVSLLDRIKRDREASKANVQAMTDKFCADAWRGNKFAYARLFIDRLLMHPLGGKQWVMKALDDLRQYVERKGN